VRKAVELLVADGYVSKQPGVGTTVLNFKMTQNLNSLTSLTETLTKKGYEVSVKDIRITCIDADKELLKIFNMNKPCQMACIYRLVYASGEPLGLIQNYIPYYLVQGIEKDAGHFKSLYKHLEAEYSLAIEMAKDHIFATAADREDAEKLCVEEGFPLICVNRICLLSGEPVIYDTLRLRSDKYSFDISLYNRSKAP